MFIVCVGSVVRLVLFLEGTLMNWQHLPVSLPPSLPPSLLSLSLSFSPSLSLLFSPSDIVHHLHDCFGRPNYYLTATDL